MQESMESLGRCPLGAQKARFIHRNVIAGMFDGDLAPSSESIDRGLNQGRVHLQKQASFLGQPFARQVHVPLAAGFVEHVAHASLDTHVRVLADTKRSGELVRRTEPDAPHVEGEAVGILAHTFDRLCAIAFVDACGEGWRNPVALQENHDLALAALGGPGLLDGKRPRFADARNLPNAFGTGIEDFQGFLAEARDDAGREFGADALDESGP